MMVRYLPGLPPGQEPASQDPCASFNYQDKLDSEKVGVGSTASSRIQAVAVLLSEVLSSSACSL